MVNTISFSSESSQLSFLYQSFRLLGGCRGRSRLGGRCWGFVILRLDYCADVARRCRYLFRSCPTYLTGCQDGAKRAGTTMAPKALTLVFRACDEQVIVSELARQATPAEVTTEQARLLRELNRRQECVEASITRAHDFSCGLRICVLFGEKGSES
jgi:hypothetical protein